MSFKTWLLVLVLASSGTFLGMVFTVIAPVLPLIIAHFGGGASGAMIGQWILGIPSIGVIIGAPFMGLIAERIGARAALLAGFVVFGVAGVVGLFLDEPSMLLASRLFVGLAAAMQVTASTMLIGELFTDEQRGKMVGSQNALAMAIGLVLIFAAGALGQIQGWRAPFELYAVAVIPLLVGLAVIRPAARAAAKPTGASLRALLPLMPVYGLIVLTFMLSFFTSAIAPQLLAQEGLTSPAIIAAVIAISTILFVVGAFAYGTLRARLGTSLTFALGLGLQAVGILWMALAHTGPGITIGTALLQLGSGVQTPNLSHSVLDHAPPAIRGRAVGLLFSAQFLGPFAVSALLTPAMNIYGIRSVTIVLAGALLLVTATATFRARPARAPAE